MDGKKRWYLEHGGLIIAGFALLVSFVSLYFSYLASPLSDAGKPILFYSDITSQTREVRKNAPTRWSIVVLIINKSKNPAENVVVNMATWSDGPPRVVVQTGFEYQILAKTNGILSIKIPSFPAQASCSMIVSIDKMMPRMTPEAMELAGVVSVFHKFGAGIREGPEKPYHGMPPLGR